jgi:hypothetical protein
MCVELGWNEWDGCLQFTMTIRKRVVILNPCVRQARRQDFLPFMQNVCSFMYNVDRRDRLFTFHWQITKRTWTIIKFGGRVNQTVTYDMIWFYGTIRYEMLIGLNSNMSNLNPVYSTLYQFIFCIVRFEI